ncbi:hypothetical protein ACSBR2_008561 [Camellia fascicularis]
MLDPIIVSLLIDILASNPYSLFFQSLRDISNLDTHRVIIRADPCLDPRIYNAPNTSQVAAIWHENDDNLDYRERDILVHKHEGQSQRIRYYYDCYDPLQYPLLFPFGEPGWHQGIKKKQKKQNAHAITRAQSSILPQNAINADDFLDNEAKVFEENSTKQAMVSAREFYGYKL